ncbi:MAG: rhodanese-related sulfurtransferase [Brachymonas sp.]
MTYRVAALYHFARVESPEAWRIPILDFCKTEAIKGTLLLAREGINGTVAGSAAAIDALLIYLRSLPGMAALEHKESWAESEPFLRMKVKLKKEIVTMGVPEIDPSRYAGTYVQPEDWNALISDPEVLLVDTRNEYEIHVGSFAGAVNPHIEQFTEFPEWIQSEENRQGKKKIAMFCTGGIRCEKSTAYLRQQGFEDVYHLKGGILKYLEEVPEEKSLWQGECFVFDERVTVGHGLVQGEYELCRACRHPIDAQDKQSPLFEAGVSCVHCHGEQSEAQLKGLRERQKQIALAQARGERHVGKELAPVEVRRAAKRAKLAEAQEKAAASLAKKQGSASC